jgi:hypothetical protein
MSIRNQLWRCAFPQRDCLKSGGQAGAPLVDGVDEWV